MVLTLIVVVTVLVALGLWRFIAVASKGTEAGDRLFEAWYKEHKNRLKFLK